MIPTIKQEDDGKRGNFMIMENDRIAAVMTYVWVGKNKFIIDHTEVYEEHGGKGYGKELVKKGVEFAREKGVKIIPLCPYAKRVIQNDEMLNEIIFQ